MNPGLLDEKSQHYLCSPQVLFTYLGIFGQSKEKYDAGAEIADLVVDRAPGLSDGIPALNVPGVTGDEDDNVVGPDDVWPKLAWKDQGGVLVGLDVAFGISWCRLIPVLDRVVDEDLQDAEGQEDDGQGVP